MSSKYITKCTILCSATRVIKGAGSARPKQPRRVVNITLETLASPAVVQLNTGCGCGEAGLPRLTIDISPARRVIAGSDVLSLLSCEMK